MEELVSFFVLKKFDATQNIREKQQVGLFKCMSLLKTWSVRRCARCSACFPKTSRAQGLCSLGPPVVVLCEHLGNYEIMTFIIL